MFNRTDDELLEQTISVEGWHHSFQAHISSYHPVFWKFLIILRNEESLFRVSMKNILHVIHHHHKDNVTWIVREEYSQLWMTFQIFKPSNT